MENIVEVDLDNKDEYINEYDDDRVKEELRQYIVESLKSVKGKVIIRVCFHFEVDALEKKRVRDMLYRDFQSGLVEVSHEIKVLNVRDIVLLIVGLVLFFLSYFFEYRNMKLFSEFFMVVTWVAFWEVTESFLFERKRLFFLKRKYSSLIHSEIVIQ